MAGKKEKSKKGQQPIELPVDLARRIGAPEPEDPAPPTETEAPPTVLPEPVEIRPAADEPAPAREEAVRAPDPAPAFVPHREPPALGEMDVVVTPLPTPDDWHRFELALRKVKGVSRVQPEYYRHGVLKVRMAYSGDRRLAQALRELPGYRVRVIGEDRRTLQILVAPDADERRPG